MNMKPIYIIIIYTILLFPTTVAAADSQRAHELEQAGSDCFQQEHYADAVDYYMQGIRQAKASGDTHNLCACLHGIGMVYVRLNDLERGLYYFNKSYELAVKSGDSSLQARNVAHMVSAYCFNGDLEGARRYYAIQKTFPPQGDTHLEYYELFNSALIAQLENRLAESARLYDQAISYAQRHQLDDKYVSADYGLLVYVSLLQGDAATARDYCEKYRQYAQKANTRTAWKSYYEMQVAVYTSVHDTDRAEDCQRRADSLQVAIITQSQIDAVDNKIVKFEMGQNEEELDALTSLVSRQTTTIALTVLLALMLTVFAVYVYVKNRHLRKTQQLLVKKNEELMLAEQRSRQLLEQHYGNAPAPPAVAEGSDERTADPVLSQDQVNTMLRRIMDVMEDISVISQPDFNLSRLAQLVDSNTKYVSWVINNVYQKNFKTFLNEYRIREACRRLEDKEHYGNLTIQAVYKDLGYSSASNFIQAFNGVTPSTYQKLVRQNRGQSGQ